jgi:hypothetical protein
MMEVGMSMNEQRAEWARKPLQIFADEVMGGEISADTVADLICDIGHYAKLVLKLQRSTVIQLFELGLSSWKVEDENPDGNNTSSEIFHLFSIADLRKDEG